MLRQRRVYLVVLLTFVLGLSTGRAFGGQRIRIMIDNNELQTDVAPVIQDGRVLVPLRSVAQGLGAEVIWDDTNRVVNICSQKASASPAMDTNLGVLTANIDALTPASPPSIDPGGMQEDGSGPGWTPVTKFECGSWNPITHMFVGVNANPIPRGTWLRVRSIGYSRDLSATSLKEFRGIYPEGQGPDSFYVVLQATSPSGTSISYLVKSQEIHKSGYQLAELKIPADVLPGTARLVVVWGWNAPGGGYRRFAVVRTLEIVGN